MSALESPGAPLMIYEMTRVSAKTHTRLFVPLSPENRDLQRDSRLICWRRAIAFTFGVSSTIINSFSESERQENELDTYSLPGDERGRTIVPHPSAGSCASRSASKDSFAEVIEELETTR